MGRPAIETLLNVSEAKPGLIRNRGKTYKVEGYNEDGSCPTDICNAICCRISNFQGRVGQGPCEHLECDTCLCKFHKISAHLKPVSCLVWPTNQDSIDVANQTAERLGLEGRCQLRMVEVEGGEYEWQP